MAFIFLLIREDPVVADEYILLIRHMHIDE